MISLGKHRSYKNPKTHKKIKPFDASLSNFQDFLNKSLAKPTQHTSKMFSPNKTKIERLNFSNTGTSTSFLPPKSIDKHRFSSTNRASLTFQEDFLKLETPQKQQKSSFFTDNFAEEELQLTRRQIKEKTESNAMQRFKELFKKETNIKGKKIEEEQSKRLIGLLEKTSRKNRENEPQETNKKAMLPYFTTSKKSIKAEDHENLEENRNHRLLNEKLKTLDNNELRENDNGKENFKENKKTFENEIRKIQNNKIEMKKTNMTQEPREENREKEEVERKDFLKNQEKSLEYENEKKIEKLSNKTLDNETPNIDKESIKNMKKTEAISLKDIKKEATTNEQTSIINEDRKIEFKKKNSFEPEKYEIEEVKTFEKIEEKKQNEHEKTKKEEERIKLITLNDPIDTNKNQKIENKIPEGFKSTKSNTNKDSITLKTSKESITIKGSRDIKQPIIDKNNISTKQRYQQEEDDDLDLDVVQIGGNNTIVKNKNNKNIEKEKSYEDKKIDDSKKVEDKSNQNVTGKNIKISETSLAEEVQRMEASNKNIKSDSKEIEQEQEELEEDEELHPADELDYLICLVENLGRYYNKSKQFYSNTESSMVEIVMNHKLAAYYNSQQFFYYINFFIEQITENNNKNDGNNKFYTLSVSDLQEALEDESIQEAMEDLKSSCEVAKKLIKHTHEKAKIYLTKQEKELTINTINDYDAKCRTYIREEFKGLYGLYEERKSKTLAERLCYLIEIYCILKSLKEEESKEFEDLEDIGETNYHQHIIEHKHYILETK